MKVRGPLLKAALAKVLPVLGGTWALWKYAKFVNVDKVHVTYRLGFYCSNVDFIANYWIFFFASKSSYRKNSLFRLWMISSIVFFTWWVENLLSTYWLSRIEWSTDFFSEMEISCSSKQDKNWCKPYGPILSSALELS